MGITIDEIRRANLLVLIDESGGKRAALAEKINTNPAYISQLLTPNAEKRRSIGDDLSRRLEESYKKPRGWMDKDHTPTHPAPTSNATLAGGFDLWDETTPLADDEVALPFLREVELSAGNGRQHQIIENSGHKLRFAKSTLKKQGVQADSAWCVSVSGNSMEPVLPDGATVGIDTANTTIKSGKLYAIDHDGQLRIKLIYPLPGGQIRLRSFNVAEWPDEIYSGADLANIKILGRVFWSSVLW